MVCDRLTLEHQQLTRGDAETVATNTFYAERGKKKDNGKRDWKPQAESTRERSVSKDQCFHCKEKGHWARKCPKRQQETSRRRPRRGQNWGAGSSAIANGPSLPQAWTAMNEVSAVVARAKWVLDSGATHHMTSDSTQFQSLTPVQIPIQVANGATMTAEGEGDVLLNLVVEGVENQVTLKKVLYVPEMGRCGLVSVRCIQAAGVAINFADTDNTVSITHKQKVYGIAKLEHNAYVLQTADAIVANVAASTVAQRAKVSKKHGTLLDWHQRLGHISFDKVKQLANYHPEMIIE